MRSADCSLDPGRLRTIAWWAVFSACCAVLVIHFSFIQLASMPLSPIKLKYANILDAYVNPYFTQRWNFFAPDPIDRDVSLIARARDVEGSPPPLVTEWIDVTAPLLEALRRNRVTPLFLVEIGLSNAVVSFENNIAHDPRATLEKDGKTYLKAQLPATLDPLDMIVMRRTALASLEIAYPGKRFEEVQLGLVTSTFPRFTERNDPEAKAEVSMTLIDWQSATWVAPYCCVPKLPLPSVRQPGE
jgi:Family of unknown function (DUF5819)